MKTIKKTPFIIMICFLLLLSACSASKDYQDIKTTPSDIDVSKLVTKTYSEEELNSIINHAYSIEVLNEKYPIECIRRNNTGYRVVYLGESALAIIYFDYYGANLSRNIVKPTLLSSKVHLISVGKTLDDMLKIDKEGQYLFLETGRNDMPRTSIHYTTDYNMIIVYYDNNNTITSVSIELI